VNEGTAKLMDADNRPFWSVMIPCWNPDPRLLRETIGSVLAAGIVPGDMQVALVDDGSPNFDGPAFLRDAGFAKVEFHAADRHRGIAGNWNRCASLARGRWVHLLHQDDRVRAGFYGAMERGIAREPSIGAAFCQHVFIDEDGDLVREGHGPARPAGVLYDWLTHIFINLTIQCAAIVLRRDVPEALGGFDPDLAYGLDADMWQRIALAYPIWYEPAALAEHRLHRVSQSRALQKSSRKWREIALTLRRMERRLTPADAAWARPWARQVQLRVAFSAIRDALAGGHLRSVLYELRGVLRIMRPSDIWPVIRDRHPPDLSIAMAASRRPTPGERRIMLSSEFIPFRIERNVFGGFLRLRLQLEAAVLAGYSDLIFFWPRPNPPDQADADELLATLVRHWNFSGAVWLCPALMQGERRSLAERLADWLWQWRGAVGFFFAVPSMRTSSTRQGVLLRSIMHAAKPDLAFPHGMGPLAGFRRANLPHPPVLGDFPNLEHIRMARRGAVAPGLAGRLGAWGTALIARHAEKRLLRDFVAAATVCSDVDARAVANLAPALPVTVVPNAMPSVTPAPLGDEPVALFVGIFLYPPNVEALNLLREEIWPIVRHSLPKARLLVVGEGGEALRWPCDAAAGIELLDFVKDLAPLYAQARVFVAPIRRGSGTRFKIVESANYGRPCVATTIGAEGLVFRNEESILLRDSMAGFAAACIRLLEDKALAERIAAAALATAKRDYDRDHAVALYRGAIENVLAAPAASGTARR
jgi:hypothetical protein